MLRVAVGIIRDEDNRILVAQRSKGAYLEGKWEFPGGKLEHGESSRDAVIRELYEEVGVQVSAVSYLTQIVHDYDDFQVCLDIWIVDKYEGVVRGCEGQLIAWHARDAIEAMAIPPANEKILSALSLDT